MYQGAGANVGGSYGAVTGMGVGECSMMTALDFFRGTTTLTLPPRRRTNYSVTFLIQRILGVLLAGVRTFSEPGDAQGFVSSGIGARINPAACTD